MEMKQIQIHVSEAKFLSFSRSFQRWKNENIQQGAIALSSRPIERQKRPQNSRRKSNFGSCLTI